MKTDLVDVFREVRERVTAQDAARQYGLTFDRRGWALCPFHPDKKPSLSFKNGRFRCWACGASGDAIDFTGRLFGLDGMGAVKKLNVDFNLALPLDRQPTAEERKAARRRMEIVKAHKEFEAWRESFIVRLNEVYRVGWLALKRGQKWTDAETLAVQRMSEAEYLSDILENGTPEEQAQIYRERGAIAIWIEKILSD